MTLKSCLNVILNSFHFDIFYPLKSKHVIFQCSVLNSSWQILFPHLSYGSKVIMKMLGRLITPEKKCKEKTFSVIITAAPQHKSLYLWKSHKLCLPSSPVWFSLTPCLCRRRVPRCGTEPRVCRPPPPPASPPSPAWPSSGTRDMTSAVSTHSDS